MRLHRLKRRAPRITLRARAAAEAEVGLLPVFAPQPVRLPGVYVAVRVERGDEDPVEFVDELCDGGGFAVGGYERPGDVGYGGGGDPFAGVQAAGYDD
ncbi:hypothetical protein V494_07863, partial [Pseudogymnoascus sp. VKM F-4513 (FW-928)]